MSEKQKNATAYWKENLKYLIILLLVWFIVSFGCGILFREELNICIRNSHFRLCKINE